MDIIDSNKHHLTGGFRGIGRRSPRRGSSPPPAAPRFGGRFGRSRSRSPTDLPLTPEERDSRTIFVMQLSQVKTNFMTDIKHQ